MTEERHFDFPWLTVTEHEAHALAGESRRELALGHPLWNKTQTIQGRRLDRGSLPRYRLDGSVFVVQRAWSDRRESGTEWPHVEQCRDFSEFVRLRMHADRQELA